MKNITKKPHSKVQKPFEINSLKGPGHVLTRVGMKKANAV